MFPPTATVCRPQRVWVSTIWKMIVSTTAQMKADHPQALLPSLPKNFPMCSAEVGMLTGSPCEVVRTRPYSTNPVPRVAMNDGSRSVTTRNPLTKPTNRPKTRETMMARMAGNPSSVIRKYIRNGAMVNT